MLPAGSIVSALYHKLPEDGISDAETSRSGIILYIYVSKMIFFWCCEITVYFNDNTRNKYSQNGVI